MYIFIHHHSEQTSRICFQLLSLNFAGVWVLDRRIQNLRWGSQNTGIQNPGQRDPGTQNPARRTQGSRFWLLGSWVLELTTRNLEKSRGFISSTFLFRFWDCTVSSRAFSDIFFEIQRIAPPMSNSCRYAEEYPFLQPDRRFKAAPSGMDW